MISSKKTRDFIHCLNHSLFTSPDWMVIKILKPCLLSEAFAERREREEVWTCQRRPEELVEDLERAWPATSRHSAIIAPVIRDEASSWQLEHGATDVRFLLLDADDDHDEREVYVLDNVSHRQNSTVLLTDILGGRPGQQRYHRIEEDRIRRFKKGTQRDTYRRALRAHHRRKQSRRGRGGCVAGG